MAQVQQRAGGNNSTAQHRALRPPRYVDIWAIGICFGPRRLQKRRILGLMDANDWRRKIIFGRAGGDGKKSKVWSALGSHVQRHGNDQHRGRFGLPKHDMAAHWNDKQQFSEAHKPFDNRLPGIDGHAFG